MSAFLKKEELTEAQKETGSRPVTWLDLLLAAIIVPLLILLF
jgi:hypothetical protein